MKQPHEGIWHAVLILLISGCGGGGGAGGGSSLISVPSLTGLSQTAAAQALNADGLAMQIPFGEQLSAKVPVGVVMSQSPTAGATVAKGTQIALVLSNGPPHT